MKLKLKYARDLDVTLRAKSESDLASYAVFDVEIPRYLFERIGLDEVERTLSSSQAPENVYSPETFLDDRGNEVKKLKSLSDPRMEYLRFCHKAIETYKMFVESGVTLSMARAVLPPFSLETVTLRGSIPQWRKWIEKALSSHDEILVHLASKVTAKL